MKMHPPWLHAPFFGQPEPVVIFRPRVLLCSAVLLRTERNAEVKLKIRYENAMQTLELNAEDTEQLWVSLSLEGEGLSQTERERLIQDAWEERYNRPDYNNWHKHSRHTGKSKALPDEDKDEAESNEPLLSEVTDASPFWKPEWDRDLSLEEEYWRAAIRQELKPDYAEMLIGIHLDGLSVTEYARQHGEQRTTVSHRLQRAEKKFQEIFPRTSQNAGPRGYQLRAVPLKTDMKEV